MREVKVAIVKQKKVHTLIEKLPAGAILNYAYPIEGGIGFDITYPENYREVKEIEGTASAEEIKENEKV